MWIQNWSLHIFCLNAWKFFKFAEYDMKITFLEIKEKILQGKRKILRGRKKNFSRHIGATTISPRNIKGYQRNSSEFKLFQRLWQEHSAANNRNNEVWAIMTIESSRSPSDIPTIVYCRMCTCMCSSDNVCGNINGPVVFTSFRFFFHLDAY